MADLLRRRRGSSPLARGLLAYAEELSMEHGIIPARAGFTTSKGGRRCPECGSSPLARGLLAVCCGCRPSIRIIPARAGFTRPQLRGRPLPADHPRSRGVYHSDRCVRIMSPGSSPLARGLPSRTVQSQMPQGIIPARAGFTENVPLTFSVRGDHPRSRGVYRRVMR